ncbi:tetratricopeptide repeat protein [Actinoplanes solisilvae]|uniref:tetratricopeptide repeat protein n=1 Tax=Actinoplanes solisilvae TaxID=2486853 RepID=UPI0013E2AB4F|nr:tetratricopeptide repeat protein [Actinoplanes solisilvae]
MTTEPNPFRTAFARLRGGRLGRNTVKRSPQWASAQCDRGNEHLEAGRVDRAIECFRQAASVPPRDHETRKDQLTYRLNLGLALRMAGRLDEAERELRLGLAERLDFYGREHAGYAFGLEPLADLLRRRGQLEEARRLADEAVTNLRANGHERVASALALRAAIVHAAEAVEPLFADLGDLPDDVIAQISPAVVGLAEGGEPELLVAVVAALEERLGPDHEAVIIGLSGLANLGRATGDHAGRIRAIERVLASHDRRGRDEDAVMAMLGLALAQDDAGDREAALRTYASAHERVAGLDRPGLRSQALRNWGLLLKEAGDVEAAEKRLTEALAEARRGADPGLVGSAGVALGLLLQHEGRLDEAGPVLEDALAVLDPVHRDALVGRSHLSAARDGRTCGCADYMGDTMAGAFRDFVVGRLPADLLDRLDVALVDGDFQIEVALRREPTQEELAYLNDVLTTAQDEFRSRILN